MKNRRSIFKLIAGTACAAAMEITGARQHFFQIAGIDPAFTPDVGRAKITIFKTYIQEKTLENGASVFQFSDEEGLRWGPIFNSRKEASDAFLQTGFSTMRRQPETAWADNELSRLRKQMLLHTDLSQFVNRGQSTI